MNNYAILFYGDEGMYFYFRLGSHITLDKARDAALEYIASGHMFQDDGDLHFEIVEIGAITEYTTADYQPFFKKKTEEERKRRKEEQDKAEKIKYEELKKKFDN